ncbi:MAG TPA: hypothetical protein VLV88_01325 [Terriglobales bacterium]|nr:hypothetical protein [Terriglobales bacterium]
MRRIILTLAVASSLITPLAMTGCAVRARYYDVDHHDYHRWNHDEDRFYVQWESDTHRQHRDFKDRSQQEQQAYWDWRHEHEQNQH